MSDKPEKINNMMSQNRLKVATDQLNMINSNSNKILQAPMKGSPRVSPKNSQNIDRSQMSSKKVTSPKVRASREFEDELEESVIQRAQSSIKR